MIYYVSYSNLENIMSPSFKGIMSIIISVLFFFPWVWSAILHIKLPAYALVTVGLIAAIIAIVLGFQARKGGSRVLGMVGMTLGVISVVISVVNLISFIR